MRWVLRGSGRWVSRGGGVMVWAVVTSSHLTFWRLHSRRGQRQTLSLLPLTLSILPLSPQVFFSFFLLFFIFCLETIESSDCQVAQVYRHSKPLLSLFFFLGLSNSNLSSSMSVFSPLFSQIKYTVIEKLLDLEWHNLKASRSFGQVLKI